MTDLFLWGLYEVAIETVTLAVFLFVLYHKGYFEKRGATAGELEERRNKLDLILEEVRKSTTASEEVRTQLAGGLWQSQERWQRKLEAIKVLWRWLESLEGVAIAALAKGKSQRTDCAHVFVDMWNENEREFGIPLADARVTAELLFRPKLKRALDACVSTYTELQYSESKWTGTLGFLIGAERSALRREFLIHARDALGAFSHDELQSLERQDERMDELRRIATRLQSEVSPDERASLLRQLDDIVAAMSTQS